jgi:hypothetical protein
MQIKETYRSNMIVGYTIIFYMLMVYKFFNGMFLFQMQPSFFYTREDLFTWIFMLTGFHKFLLNNQFGCIIMDVLFYTAPIVFYLLYRQSLKNKTANFNRFNIARLAAIGMLFINVAYIQCYTLYPTNSIEAHIAWMLFPIVFIAKDIQVFKLLMDGIRYFLLYFLMSAGIWKIAQGGIFNTHQMSNILLVQHKEILVITPQHWYSKFIQFLINTPKLSYALYFAGTIFELSCLVGFFTKKYDRFIVVGWLFFLCFDHFIMRIPYYEISALLLPFIISAENSKSKTE